MSQRPERFARDDRVRVKTEARLVDGDDHRQRIERVEIDTGGDGKHRAQGERHEPGARVIRQRAVRMIT